MREKLFEIVNQQPLKMLCIGKKVILVEERFGERKNIIKNYRITSISIENGKCLISYVLVDEEYFLHTSYIEDLSNTFIAQVLSEIL